jgi:general secretion pathway protein K
LSSAADRSQGKSEEGIALLVILLLLTVLLLMAFEFAFTSRTEVDMAGNYRDSTRAYFLALAALDEAVRELSKPADFCFRDEETGEVYFARNTDPPERVESLIAWARENQQRLGFELGDGVYSYSIRDEDGLFQINRADREGLVQLLDVLGVQIGTERDEIVDAILDWRDLDDLRGLNGAEDEFYNNLEIPYSTRGARFETLEELLMVRGITPELFYGDDSQPGLRDLVTVWGNQRTPNRFTAPYPVLAATRGEIEADQMRIRREDAPMASGRGRSRREVLSSYYTILAEGQIPKNKVYRQIRAVVQVIGRGGGSAATVQVIHWDDAAAVPPRRVIP